MRSNHIFYFIFSNNTENVSFKIVKVMKNKDKNSNITKT